MHNSHRQHTDSSWMYLLDPVLVGPHLLELVFAEHAVDVW